MAGSASGEFFARLGALVEGRWRDLAYDEDLFPDVAEQALTELPPSLHLGAYDTLAALLTTPSLPRQLMEGEPFGQPPVQVFIARNFYIEVLHWIDGTTAIHEHAFNGAFHVLAGSSVHCTYRFVERRRYNARIRVGEVQRDRAELLARGDTRKILAGAAMSHSLFHLDRPSVSVVVRSYNAPGSDPQYTYLPPGLAVDLFRKNDLRTRQVQALATLHAVGHPELAALAGHALREADPLTLYHLAAALRPLLPTAEHDALLEEARPRHAELVDALRLAMAERRRQETIIGLRRKMRAPDHRFLLALLLHFTRGADVLELVARRHPDRDPGDVVIGWMRECADLEDPEQPGRRVFDLSLHEGKLRVLKLLLGGRPLDEVKRILVGELGAEVIAAQDEALTAFAAAARAMDVFAPLFA